MHEKRSGGAGEPAVARHGRVGEPRNRAARDVPRSGSRPARAPCRVASSGARTKRPPLPRAPHRAAPRACRPPRRAPSRTRASLGAAGTRPGSPPEPSAASWIRRARTTREPPPPRSRDRSARARTVTWTNSGSVPGTRTRSRLGVNHAHGDQASSTGRSDIDLTRGAKARYPSGFGGDPRLCASVLIRYPPPSRDRLGRWGLVASSLASSQPLSIARTRGHARRATCGVPNPSR